MDGQQIQLALQRRWDQLALGRAQVGDVTRLSGGASQETWRFQLSQLNGTRTDLILRRSPIEGPRNGEALSLKTEANILIHAAIAGIFVPKVVHICEPGDGLGDAFIMGFISGETIARKILRDPTFEVARAGLAHQCGTQLAKIHGMPIERHRADLPTSDGLDQLTRYQQIYDGFETRRPVLELAFSWLRQTAPQPVANTLVHGDFRNGNFIVNADGLKSVLDWELAHIGDPREDIGWICVNSWRFGQHEKSVGGFGELDNLLDAYQIAGGAHFSLDDIKWFQALGSLKWGIMCLIMYHAFKTGADPSIERAMIGRRTSEAEIDLLNLMEGRKHA